MATRNGNIARIVLIVLGIIPLIGIQSGGLSLVIFSIFVLLWLFRVRLRALVRKIPLQLFVKFVSLGIVFGLLAECLVFLDSGIGIYGKSGLFSDSLLFNLVLSMGIYGSLIIIWYFLSRRYKFSLIEVFLLAGIWGVVIEQDFAVLLSLDVLAYIYIFAVYGSIVSIPFLLVGDAFDKMRGKEDKVKYIVAFLAQFLAYIFGSLWISLLRAVSGG